MQAILTPLDIVVSTYLNALTCMKNPRIPQNDTRKEEAANKKLPPLVKDAQLTL
jgi:hypothetical protein